MSSVQGSLDLLRGTLAVGVQAKTASVRFFDLDGHPLSEGFSFRDPHLGRSVAAGLALDEDHRVWVADTPASRVRCFSLFGREVGGLTTPDQRAGTDLAGNVDAPCDVAIQAGDEGERVVVVCGGERRNAVQLFDPSLGWMRSLASLGDPQRAFRGARRAAALGRFLFVVESTPRSVQVFRDGEFLFLFHVPGRAGERYELTAVAPLPDGRVVVACGGTASALLLLDGAGRLLRVLAQEGPGEGQVFEPSDLVVEPGQGDAHTRVFAIDRDGVRVQVLTLAGRCLGSIPIQAAPAARRAREKEAD